MLSLLIATAYFMVVLHHTAVSALWNERRVAEQIFANYSPDVRPAPTTPGGAVNVAFEFSLFKIEQLDEKNQQMISVAFIYMIWEDSDLAWELTPEDEYTGYIITSASKVWLPEVALLNSMDNPEDITADVDSRVGVVFTGEVHCSLGIRLVTSCEMDLKYFPFDIQVCEAIFMNWIHTEALENFTNIYEFVLLDLYEDNGEWDIIRTSTFRRSNIYRPDVILPEIGFQLVLQRIPTYFVYTIIIPVSMLVFLTVLVFVLPSEAGEKVSMQVTILLAHSVMLLVLSDIMPRTLKTTPILTQYITFAMGYSASSLVVSVYLLNLHHHSNRPIPRWLKVLVLYYMARWIGFKKTHGGEGATYPDPADKDIHIISSSDYHIESENPDVAVEKTGSDGKQRTIVRIVRTPPDTKAVRTSSDAALPMIRDPASDPDDHSGDWHMLSRVLERLFFIIYTLALLGSSTVIYVYLFFRRPEEQP